MTEQKKAIILILTSTFLAAIIITVLNTRNKNDLAQNMRVTKGIVIDFYYSNFAYIIEYEYIVDGNTYTNKENLNYFNCDDGTPGCKGKEFTVKYSSKNPKNSIIDLGKFNNKKPFKPSF